MIREYQKKMLSEDNIESATSKTRVAINGFGRIGRLCAKAILQKDEFELVAVNDPMMSADSAAYLFKYDSIHGTNPLEVCVESSESFIVNGTQIKILTLIDPGELPWKELRVDIVIEASGIHNSTEKSISHIYAGAKKVILTAPPTVRIVI